MPRITPLGELATKIMTYGADKEAEAGIALMVADVALQLARAQLVTLGGDGSGPDGDKIQKAVLDQIDVALERK